MSSDVSMAPIYETEMRLHTKIRRQGSRFIGNRFSRWLICAVAGAVIVGCLFPAAVPVEAKKKPPRVVKVKIVADQDFARQSAWQRKAAYMLQDIGGETASALDVTFRIIGYERWRHDPEKDLFRLTARMVKEVPCDSADALIGFTLAPCPDSAAGQFAGVSITFKGMIIQTYQGRCAGNQMVPYCLLHETVHLMGGVHVPDGSLMSPLFRDTISVTLDQLNSRILQLTRDVDFKRGYESLPAEKLEELAGLYGQATAGNDVTTILVTLGTIFRLLAQPEAAMVILREVIRQDSSFTDAWLELGRCYMQSGRHDSALTLYDSACGHADDPGAVYLELARLYLGRGDKENARRCAGLAEKQGTRIDSALAEQLESDSKSE